MCVPPTGGRGCPPARLLTLLSPDPFGVMVQNQGQPRLPRERMSRAQCLKVHREKQKQGAYGPFCELREPERLAVRREEPEGSADGAHSLRIGGATAALAAGVPALVIKAMGRSGSDIYEVYTQLSDAAARSFGSKVANVDYDYVEGAYYSEEL